MRSVIVEMSLSLKLVLVPAESEAILASRPMMELAVILSAMISPATILSARICPNSATLAEIVEASISPSTVRRGWSKVMSDSGLMTTGPFTLIALPEAIGEIVSTAKSCVLVLPEMTEPKVPIRSTTSLDPSASTLTNLIIGEPEGEASSDSLNSCPEKMNSPASER